VIVCPRCSKENQDHYKFCLGCGAELPREAAKKDFVARAGRVGYLEMNACFWGVSVCSGAGGVSEGVMLAPCGADVPVSYTTVRSRTLMSLPKTLQGAPARTSLAVNVGPSTFTLVALYPGQASNSAGSTSSARATSGAGPSKEKSTVSTPQRRGTESIVRVCGMGGKDEKKLLEFYSGDRTLKKATRM